MIVDTSTLYNDNRATLWVVPLQPSRFAIFGTFGCVGLFPCSDSANRAVCAILPGLTGKAGAGTFGTCEGLA